MATNTGKIAAAGGLLALIGAIFAGGAKPSRPTMAGARPTGKPGCKPCGR